MQLESQYLPLSTFFERVPRFYPPHDPRIVSIQTPYTPHYYVTRTPVLESGQVKDPSKVMALKTGLTVTLREVAINEARIRYIRNVVPNNEQKHTRWFLVPDIKRYFLSRLVGSERQGCYKYALNRFFPKRRAHCMYKQVITFYNESAVTAGIPRPYEKYVCWQWLCEFLRWFIHHIRHCDSCRIEGTRTLYAELIEDALLNVVDTSDLDTGCDIPIRPIDLDSTEASVSHSEAGNVNELLSGSDQSSDEPARKQPRSAKRPLSSSEEVSENVDVPRRKRTESHRSIDFPIEDE